LYTYCRNNPVIYYDPSGYNGLLNCPQPGFATDPDGLLGLPEPGETSSRRAEAERKLAEAALGTSISPTIDPVTGLPVSGFFVDPNGNTMIAPVGGNIDPVGRGYKGLDTHTLYPNGSAYQRNNPSGHAGTPGDNHGHAMGTGSNKNGTGPSLDINGNIVPYNSKAAHWETKK